MIGLTMSGRFRSWLRALVGRKRLERELCDELQFHVRARTEYWSERGYLPAEAARRARAEFGSIEASKETSRQALGLRLLDETRADLRYTLRQMRAAPGFTAIAVLMLAVAIGTNTAVFSVLNAVVLRPLPFTDPEQLVVIWNDGPGQPMGEGRTAYGTVDAWRRATPFTDLAVFDPVSATLTIGSESTQLSVARVSPSLFPLLGLQPVVGRAFSVEEAEARQRLAVISHRFWQARFGGRGDAVGASMLIDGAPVRVIGVLPAGARPPFDSDVWEPHTAFADWDTRRLATGAGSWFVIGRLQPDATIAQAQAEVGAIARDLNPAVPADQERRISVAPLHTYAVGPVARMALWMLTAAGVTVLLIAAANVASLTLARSVGRVREIATRTALGASRARIVRQLLAESVSFGLLGGAAGLVLAVGGIRVIQALEPRGLPRLDDAGLAPAVLAWTLGISFISGTLVGLAPALTMRRAGSSALATEDGRGAAGGRATRRLRRALVVGELALAIVLLAGAGLFLRSWWNVERVDSGFDTRQVVALQISTQASRTAVERTLFLESVLEQVEAVPGVRDAAVISDLFVGGSAEVAMTAEGPTGSVTRSVRFRSDEASGDVFRVVGTQLLSGRTFSSEDGPDAPRVAIINQVMAARLWPGDDPVGRRFRIGPNPGGSPWFTVIGVVADMRREGPEHAPIPQIFQPIAQNPPRLATLLVRTESRDPLTIVESVQSAVRRVDPRTPIYGISTLDTRLGAYVSPRRFQTSLLIAFSGVALLIAIVGIYGLVQYSVTARSREIAIRMAVGAQRSRIFRMIVREGLVLCATGVAIGLGGAVVLARAASTLLFGVSPHDPLTLAAVSLLLGGVALVACCVPALRAAKTQPASALRQSQ